MGMITNSLCLAVVLCSGCIKGERPTAVLADFKLGENTILARRAAEAQECAAQAEENPESERSCADGVEKRWAPTLAMLVALKREWCEHRIDPACGDGAAGLPEVEEAAAVKKPKAPTSPPEPSK